MMLHEEHIVLLGVLYGAAHISLCVSCCPKRCCRHLSELVTAIYDVAHKILCYLLSCTVLPT